MPVAGVARIGHQDLIPGVDQRQAGQLQRGRRAGGQHDAAGRDVHTEALRIPATDALAQRLKTRGLGVLGGTGLDGCDGRLLHPGWRGEIGLADVQEDHRHARWAASRAMVAATLATSMT
jgi:hypothetical protein